MNCSTIPTAFSSYLSVMYKLLFAHCQRSHGDISMKTPAVVTQVICDVNLSSRFCWFLQLYSRHVCQSAGWWSSCDRQWLTMRWMCCRAGVWGCGSPLWGCVWAGSGWGPWAGLEPGLRSPLAWTCATDSEPSSASVLPDPISPGRPGTARSLWLSSRESPAPAAPWRRSRRSTRRPGLYNYCGRDRLGVLAQCNLGKMMINTLTCSELPSGHPSAGSFNPNSYQRAARWECLLFMWQDQDIHQILPW